MNEFHFDVNAVIGIKILPERSVGYEWSDAVPEIRRFFGLIRTRAARPAGFVDSDRDWSSWVYTAEELREKGYLVYDTDQRLTDRVCHKPHVSVYLIHENSVGKSFDTIEEAHAWVEELKAISGKTYEIVKY